MFSLKIGRQCTPPPQTGKVEISGQGDILILANVPPPPQEWKSWIQVKGTFWFWLMYPCPEIAIGLNMNAIGTTIIWREVIKYILPIYPPFHSSTIIWLYAWTGNWWISISNGYLDLNPIHHPSPAKKIKCSFLDYVQLLEIGWAGRWTRTPCITPLQPKKWNAHFWIMFNFWWLAGLVDGLGPHLPPHSSQKNEMLVFGLHSTSDDQPGWSMDSNPVHHPSPAKKIKCSFLAYVQLLRIGWAIWAKNVDQNAEKWKRPPKSLKNKMLIFGLPSTSDDRPSYPSKKHWPKHKKIKKVP